MGGSRYSVLQYDELSPDDMVGGAMISCDMIVSQHDRYAYDSYNSRRVSIGSIRDNCVQCLREAAVFGSMLSEQSADYALVSHSHTQYSKNTIQTYAYDLSIGNFFLDGSLHTIGISNKYQEQIQRLYDSIDENRVGTLKFMSIDTLDSIDTAAADFDGWVYPDGATYKIVDFKYGAKCKTLFGGPSSDSTRFRVPTLSDFVCIKTFGVVQICQGYTSVKPHTHNVSFNLSAENVGATIVVKERGRGGRVCGDEICIRQSSSSHPFDAEARVSVEGHITTNNSINIMLVPGVTSNLRSTPSYIDTPVMIYIGGRV